jgi:hypothetical protein
MMMTRVQKYTSLGTKRRQPRNTIGGPEAVNPAERTESSELRTVAKVSGETVTIASKFENLSFYFQARKVCSAILR